MLQSSARVPFLISGISGGIACGVDQSRDEWLGHFVVFANFQTNSAFSGPGESMRLQFLQWGEEIKELLRFLACCCRSQCVAELK